MVGYAGNLVGNLLILLREYQKLHRLPLPEHDIVEHQALYDHCTESKHHFTATEVDGTKRIDEKTAADDADIYHDECLAQCDVVKLIEHGRHNVCTTGTSVVEKYDGECGARHHTANEQ